MSDDPTTPSRTAIVTGGGSGIGRSAALALAADGWTVVVAGRRPGPLEQVSVQSERIVPVVADVSVEADVRRLFDETVDRFGRVDLLFNNAGTGAAATPFDELTLEDVDEVLAATGLQRVLPELEHAALLRCRLLGHGRDPRCAWLIRRVLRYLRLRSRRTSRRWRNSPSSISPRA